MPSVAYDFVRAGADARIALGGVSLHARGAYLLLLGYGGLRDRNWLPNSRDGRGVEAELASSLALSQVLCLRVGAGLVRYHIALHSQPDDQGVVVFARAASAVADQTMYGFLSADLTF